MTFKILREKSKPFINFETIIEDLVQVSSDSDVGDNFVSDKKYDLKILRLQLRCHQLQFYFSVSNCFCREKSKRFEI